MSNSNTGTFRYQLMHIWEYCSNVLCPNAEAHYVQCPGHAHTGDVGGWGRGHALLILDLLLMLLCSIALALASLIAINSASSTFLSRNST